MRIHERKFTFRDKLLFAFFPERCPYCNKVVSPGTLACSDCEKEKNGITYTKPAIGGYPSVSAMPYVGVFANGIKRFKFKNNRQCAYQLAYPMAEAVIKCYGEQDFDAITFVPLHKARFEERGYNQSELLANELGKILNIPVISLLRKTRNNEPQHTMNGKKRAENVRGAYKVSEKDKVVGRRILLVDDIITTGNTLGECAKTLSEAGAESIHCVTFAVAVAKIS